MKGLLGTFNGIAFGVDINEAVGYEGVEGESCFDKV